MKQPFMTLLFLVSICTTSCGQETDSCEMLLQQELLCTSKGISQENALADITVLKKCSTLDSIDKSFLLDPPTYSVWLMEAIPRNQKVTYAMALETFATYSKSEKYKALREYLRLELQKEPLPFLNRAPNLMDESAMFADMSHALNESKKTNKKLLLYFSGKFSMNCRKIEKDVLSDETISKTIQDNFVFKFMYLDDSTRGKEFIALQNKYNSESQPFFVILNSNGKPLKKQDYTGSIADFKLFLE